MPGFFTHSYVIHEALRSFAPRNEVFKSVCSSHDTACAYGKAGKWTQYDKDMDCVKAGCTYLGASGPDLFYLETIAVKGKAERKLGAFVADLRERQYRARCGNLVLGRPARRQSLSGKEGEGILWVHQGVRANRRAR